MNNNLLRDALTLRHMMGLDTTNNLLGCLLKAAKHDYIKIFHCNGQIAGYVAWACVNKETFRQMIDSPYLPAFDHEYSEGKLMLIFDVTFNKNLAILAKRELISFLSKRRFLSVLKSNRLRSWTKWHGKFLLKHYKANNVFSVPRLIEDSMDKIDIDIPKKIHPSNISIVIPVKNNQAGINKLLYSIEEYTPPDSYPLEVIIVDNNSDNEVVVEGHFSFPVFVEKCKIPGAGAARNVGAKMARGSWLLFTDSDCIATLTSISGYVSNNNTYVGFAGSVEVLGDDAINTFYRNDETLQPEFSDLPNSSSPLTIVTANCLILKSAFLALGGFDESFIGGGEDTDFGYRLQKLGRIAFNWNAKVIHEFEVDFLSFFNRFFNYGKGDWNLDQKYHLSPFNHFKHSLKNIPTTKSAAIRFLRESKMHAFEMGYKSKILSRYLHK